MCLVLGFLEGSLGAGLGKDAGAGSGIEAVVDSVVGGGKLWREGGGDGRVVECAGREGCGGDGAGAMGEEERVIVSGIGFDVGRDCKVGSGFAVGGGVVGFLDWAGCRLRKKPPSVTSWFWPGSGLGERRGAGEVGSAGGVGREC
jgi:hypothetical protein